MMELADLRIGDVIWSVETGHTGRVCSIQGKKMTLLDPTGAEAPFYFVPALWEKLDPKGTSEFIALLQKQKAD